MKCFSLRTTRFRRRRCLIMVVVLILTFINLLLCTWKWQDKEFELNSFELTFLKKRINFNQKPFTKASWQSKANAEGLDHMKSGQRGTKRKRPRPTQSSRAIHYSTVMGRREIHTSPVYPTMLRREDRASATNEYKQVIARTGGLPVKKGLISKVRSNNERAKWSLIEFEIGHYKILVT